MAIAVVISLWTLPVVIYCLRAGGLVSERVADVLYGLTCIAIATSFVVLGALMYMQSGETIKPIKRQYETVPADDSVLWHLLAWAVWLFVSGGLFVVGCRLLRRRKQS
jgi:hypothetical protein